MRAQALLEAEQRPAVLGVQLEVAAVDALGLLDATLLEQERAERVRRRLEPAPRLVVLQRLVLRDRVAQVLEGALVAAARYSSSPASIERPMSSTVRVGLLPMV